MDNKFLYMLGAAILGIYAYDKYAKNKQAQSLGFINFASLLDRLRNKSRILPAPTVEKMKTTERALEQRRKIAEFQRDREKAIEAVKREVAKREVAKKEVAKKEAATASQELVLKYLQEARNIIKEKNLCPCRPTSLGGVYSIGLGRQPGIPIGWAGA